MGDAQDEPEALPLGFVLGRPALHVVPQLLEPGEELQLDQLRILARSEIAKLDLHPRTVLAAME